MNKHGQALIEFVLLLPIILLLIFAFIDSGNIILCKNHLEGEMTNVFRLIDDGKNVEEINNYLKEDNSYKIKVNIIENDYKKIVLETKINLITPGLSRIFSETVKVERSFIDE